MAGKRRSGLANDRRAYGPSRRCTVVPTYTVIYNGNTKTSGNAPIDGASPYATGSTVTVLGNSDLEKLEFAFVGWNTASNGSGTSYSEGDEFIINANTTLYAQWTPTYTVTYSGNGELSGNSPIDGSSPYITGSTVTVLGNSGSLIKSGYIFAGWNTVANGSGTSYSQGNTFTIINANTILYARWTPTYTVIYDGNANTSGISPNDGYSPYVSGSTVTVIGNIGSPALAKTGYVFTGWNTAANGSGTSYSQGGTFIISSNTTLCAQWTPTYTVIYDGNTNTSGISPNDGYSPYASGSTVTVIGNIGSPVLAKTGYIFAGWNTAANGSGTSYSQSGTFIISSNTTLYARWTPSYTVIYDGNTNTSGISPNDGYSPYASGSTVTVIGNIGSPVLEKEGLVFAGWNTAANGSGTSYSQGGTFIISSNTTLYARWTNTLPPSAPTALSAVAGNTQAYILFTQSGTVTNYEYSTDNGVTFLAFSPPQIFSPVNITALSSDGVTPLTNGTTYTVKLKAVNAGVSSSDSLSVNVVPTVTTLLATNRIIYLDANNTSSYPGSGTAWTNLDSSGAYSATLNGSPTFDNAAPGNKYFEFNQGALTGQFAQINQAAAINPVANSPFTIQMWVRINNVGSQGTLVSKVYLDGETGPDGFSGANDGYALGYKTDTTLQLHANGSQVNYFNSVAGVLSSGWALYTANVQFGPSGSRENKIFANARQLGVTQVNHIGVVKPNAISTDTGISRSTKNLTFPSGFGGEGECDIGQFYYYNTELTPTQIIQNFDATKSTYNV